MCRAAPCTGWGLAVWVLSAVVVIAHPRVEDLLARKVYRLRPPSTLESQRLGPAWWAVCTAAGVDPNRYRVWVHEGPEATAPATAGTPVAVTSWAVYVLPPRHLEAVLAHELAHRLAIPRLPSLLLYWLTLPARLMGKAILFGLRHRVLSVLVKVVIGFLLIGVLGVWVFLGFNHYVDFMLSPFLAPLVVPWAARVHEKLADQAAADLGYGALLAESSPAATTLLPAASAASARARPKPRDAPVMRQVFVVVAATVELRARSNASLGGAGFGFAFERARILSVSIMTTTSDSRTWIITGASSGLGLALAEAALQAGERVVGTARRADRFDALKARVRRSTSRDRARRAGHARRPPRSCSARWTCSGESTCWSTTPVPGRSAPPRDHGRPNCGTCSSSTCSARPPMCERCSRTCGQRRSGAIVQMSSQGGRMSFPAVGSYSAGKFALEGWSEALAGEVAPFGIRVLIVEPSRFRTEFNATDVLNTAEQDPTYDEVIGAVRANMAEADGIQEGDPDTRRRRDPRHARHRGRATAAAPRSRSGPQPHPRLPARARRRPEVGRRERVSGLPRHAPGRARVLTGRVIDATGGSGL